MTISVRDAGVFKTATPHVRDAGAWKAVQNGYVRDAGTWKEFFTAVAVNISFITAANIEVVPSPATAVYQLNSNGNISATAFAPLAVVGTWVLPTSAAGAAFECRATLLSGSITGTFGTWLPLSISRQWSLTAASGTSQVGSMTLEIRRAADGVVLDSDTISFSAESTP